MLSTIAFVVAALSTGHKIGLAAVGVAFIIFALVSSLVLPRRNPDFPGRGLAWYVTLCVLFFVAMLSAVLVFGKEKKEPAAATQAAAPTTTAATATTAPPSTATATTATPTPATPTPATSATPGDPVAGKQVFANSGCSGCHTLKAAGSSGNVGPNLDDKKPAFARIVTQVEKGGGPMPAYKGQLSATQIQDVAAFVYASTHP